MGKLLERLKNLQAAYEEEAGEWDEAAYTEDYPEEYEDGEYSEEEEYAEDDEYPEEEEYAEDDGYPEEGEYVEDDGYPEEEEYAEDDGYPEEEEYAEDDGYPEEGEYVEDDGYSEEEEYAGDDGYPEEGGYAEDDEYPQVGGYGEEEEYPEEYEAEEYYESEAHQEDDEAEAAAPMYNRPKKKSGVFAQMGIMDKVITFTGILIIGMVLIVGIVYVSGKLFAKEEVFFETAGAELAGIDLIGEKGLDAIEAAEQDKLEVPQEPVTEEPEETPEYEEIDYAKDVEVTLSVTSIEKDLKLKFVNKKTKKLVANVPFMVTVKDADGNIETWTDEDMDGIIYRSGVTPGNYSVAMVALEEEKYAKYGFATSAKDVTVKNKIDYQKVEVADEIHDETEVNVKEEDTRENETKVESALTDTVGWVESTRTVLDAVYTAVPKSNIPDPMAAAKAAVPMGAAVESQILAAGNTQEMEAVVEMSVLADGNTPVQGTKTVMEMPALAGELGTVGNAVTGITFEKSSLVMMEGGAVLLNVTVSPADALDKSVGFYSSDETVAVVDSMGMVTALKPGVATITAYSNAVPGVTAVCQIEVTGAVESRTLSLNQTSFTIQTGSTAVLVASIQNSIEGGSIAGSISAESSNPEICEVVTDTAAAGATSFSLVPKAGGTAVITVRIDGTEIAQTCTVTVGSKTLTLDKTALKILSGGSAELTAVVSGVGGEVTAASSDANVAVASVSSVGGEGLINATITVTGVSAGTATITVVHTEGGAALSQNCTVTVSGNDSKLVDDGGQQFYVLQADGTYREATYTDYYDAAITTFYLRADGVVKYTGWQTLDGKMYYFDASGKKVTGEQVIQGAKYSFASDGSLVVGNGTFGIDVSKWNGTIDWNAVKNSGVSYVIIRCGYRGSSTGVLVEDPMFETNIKGAAAAGIKVGIYFFSQATNKAEAIEEASMVLELIEGHTISYPVFLDVEASGGRGDKIDSATRTEVVKTFCETIQQYGYIAGVYANKTWLTEKMDVNQFAQYKIWLAQYASAPTYTGRYDMWQYKESGTVTGIKGNVDMNLSYLGY